MLCFPNRHTARSHFILLMSSSKCPNTSFILLALASENLSERQNVTTKYCQTWALWRGDLGEFDCAFEQLTNKKGILCGWTPSQTNTIVYGEPVSQPPWKIQESMMQLKEYNNTSKTDFTSKIDILSKGPLTDHTTSKTSADGKYIIFNTTLNKIAMNRNTPRSDSLLSTNFFFNKSPGICLYFWYFIHTSDSKSPPQNGGLNVYLLPCNPAYRMPVVNMTGEKLINKTDKWVLGVAPLPRHVDPYQAIFEIQNTYPSSERSAVLYVALDDVTISKCGKSTFNLREHEHVFVVQCISRD